MASVISLFLDYKVGRRLSAQLSNQVGNSTGFRMPTQICMPTQPNATVPNRAARRVEGDDWHANPALMTVKWMDGWKERTLETGQG